MPIFRRTRKDQDAAAAEFALKAHAICDHPVAADIPEVGMATQQIADAVNLTEAPEDAVCSLVIDLLHYCEREKIDWTEDVMSRARDRFRSEHAREIHKR